MHRSHQAQGLALSDDDVVRLKLELSALNLIEHQLVFVILVA